MEGGVVVIILVIVVAGMGLVVGYSIGKPGPTVTETATTTQLSTSTQYATFVQTQTRTITTATTSISTVISNSTVTSLTSTTVTKTLGTGITVTNYRLYLTDLKPDSVLKFNMTITFSSDEPTYVNEIANVILFPSNGHQNDIRFIPNPVLVSSSDFATTMTLSVYTILSHQTVSGTYLIEYAISTAQGGALVFTVLEVT